VQNGSLQGWQRVRRLRVLGQYFTAHGLTVTLDYDFRTVNEQHVWTDSQVLEVIDASSGIEQVRIGPAQGKSQAIRVTLTTTAPTVGALASGQGGAFTGFALEILPKAGGFRNLAPGAQS
jgi:hypothetical protein